MCCHPQNCSPERLIFCNKQADWVNLNLPLVVVVVGAMSSVINAAYPLVSISEFHGIWEVYICLLFGCFPDLPDLVTSRKELNQLTSRLFSHPRPGPF